MLIAAARLVTADNPDNPVPSEGFVEVGDGVVTSVSPGAAPRLADVTLTDGYLLPGFVDLQVNGYFGTEFQAPDAERWAAVAARLPSTGTTSFLPTLITAPV
ncbi:MAG: N-acetylglucosamine-6-phosphate deacetylase, partial [Actinobacteria bacterium]|nr:N-acetylglucosamine-6-phosphate deacetylase [Actinomycetota bacterium]